MAHVSLCQNLGLASILFLLLTKSCQGCPSQPAVNHRRLRDVASPSRRLAVCGWCAHGSRNWLECECEPGWEGRCCDTRVELHDGKEFALHRINNDEVENELSFAKTGSQLPTAFHGIFWMDQRGVNVPAATGASDPEYQQVGDFAADEFLVSFGEAHWDPQTRCAGPVPTYGGKKGHWTFMDQQGPPTGGNADWTTLYNNRLYLDFCFRSDTFDEADLHVHVKSSYTFGFGVSVPWWAMHLTMIKKPWGWDRQTTSFFSGTVHHYPVFQIVDGDGKRTEHYDAYLSWANNKQSTEHPSQPINKGKGTSLIGRLVN